MNTSPTTNNTDKEHPELIKIMNQTFFNYRSCIVEVLVGGYRVLGKKCLDIKGIDEVIDEGLTAIANSIKK